MLASVSANSVVITCAYENLWDTEVPLQIFLYHPLCLVSFSSQPQAKTGKKKKCLLPSLLTEKK